jgi:hypothetical protein
MLTSFKKIRYLHGLLNRFYKSMHVFLPNSYLYIYIILVSLLGLIK